MRRRPALLLGLWIWIWTWMGSARAWADPSGSLVASGLVAFDGRHGGALMADLWAGRGSLRLGGAFGAAATRGAGDRSSRVLTPLAVSLAYWSDAARHGPLFVLRVGGYAGAREGGLTAGGLASCGAGYRWSLGEGADLRMGVEGWGTLGAGGSLWLAPWLGLGF